MELCSGFLQKSVRHSGVARVSDQRTPEHGDRKDQVMEHDLDREVPPRVPVNKFLDQPKHPSGNGPEQDRASSNPNSIRDRTNQCFSGIRVYFHSKTISQSRNIGGFDSSHVSSRPNPKNCSSSEKLIYWCYLPTLNGIDHPRESTPIVLLQQTWVEISEDVENHVAQHNLVAKVPRCNTVEH